MSKNKLTSEHVSEKVNVKSCRLVSTHLWMVGEELDVKDNSLFIWKSYLLFRSLSHKSGRGSVAASQGFSARPLRGDWVPPVVRRLCELRAQEVCCHTDEMLTKLPGPIPSPAGQSSVLSHPPSPAPPLELGELTVSKDRRACHPWLFMSPPVVTCGVLALSPSPPSIT